MAILSPAATLLWFSGAKELIFYWFTIPWRTEPLRLREYLPSKRRGKSCRFFWDRREKRNLISSRIWSWFQHRCAYIDLAQKQVLSARIFTSISNISINHGNSAAAVSSGWCPLGYNIFPKFGVCAILWKKMGPMLGEKRYTKWYGGFYDPEK